MLWRTRPEELSILAETEMESTKWFLSSVSCVNDSRVSCQDHWKSDSVIICIMPRCVTWAFDRHTLYVFKSLLKTLTRRGRGWRQEGASRHLPYFLTRAFCLFPNTASFSRRGLTTQCPATQIHCGCYHSSFLYTQFLFLRLQESISTFLFLFSLVSMISQGDCRQETVAISHLTGRVGCKLPVCRVDPS